jgi:ABC-type Mn2+/Zn2+ transport system permease subunit
MGALLDPFHYDFMQRAFAEAVLMGMVCGFLGVLVVVRGLTYTGESLSHTLVPGAAVALLAGLPVLLGALTAGVLAAVAIALLLRRPDVGEETAVGVVFTGAFAVGVILLSTRGTSKDLDSLLFGSILAVDKRDLWASLAAGAGVAAACLVLTRRFVLVAFDRTFARSVGLRVELLDVALLAALAVALTVALRGVGALLVLALLVAPAATARVASRRVWTMAWLAPVVAVLCGFVGLEISYHAALAAGPAIALTALAAFGIAVGAREAVRALAQAGSKGASPSRLRGRSPAG